MLRIALATSMLLAGIGLMYAADSSPRNARRGTDCENKCNIAYSRAKWACEEKYGNPMTEEQRREKAKCLQDAHDTWDACMSACVE